MKAVLLALLLACWIGLADAAKEAEAESPLSTVINLISDMEQKAIKEGKAAQKSYEEFADVCQARAGDLGYEIKTGKASVEDLEATIAEQSATIEKLTSRIERYGADVASDSADLKKATEVREKERKAFAAEEKELMETIDMLKRAITVLESKASMLQLKNAGSLVQTFGVMVQASLIATSDADKLTAFVQATQAADGAADDGAFGAPAAAAYESKSGSIVDTLEDLLDKAETQLAESRKTETAALNNYAMLKQSMGDEIHAATEDMDDSKKGIAAASETKSSAEGELKVVKKELEADIEAKRELHHECMSRSEGFESEMKSRAAELEVLAEAKQIIKENVEGASLTQLSFVQVAARLSSRMELPNFKAVKFVRDLGRKQGSSALVQLASKMASAMRSAGGADPFEKVRGIISDMIGKLKGEASADAEKKAYCDKELKEIKEKQSDKSDEVQELDTKVDQTTAKSSKLKEDVANLQADLSKLAKTHAEMAKLRTAEKEKYDENKAMVEKSLNGVQMAIKVLKDYFSQDGASSSNAGAASSIITLLEDTESKLSAWMADLVSNEEAAASEYAAMTQKDETQKAAMETEVGYKTKAMKRLAKVIVETSTDKQAEEEQLDAVSEYYAKIKEECIAKPESYEERAKRREAELEGLKEALKILEGETSLLQRHTFRRTLRGRTLRGALQHGLMAA